MPLGSDLHSAVRDRSAPPAERAPGQLPGWDMGRSTHGMVPGTEGRNRSSLRHLHPLQKFQQTAALDGDEQLSTGGYSPPRAHAAPQPGGGMFVAMQVAGGGGSRQGK